MSYNVSNTLQIDSTDNLDELVNILVRASVQTRVAHDIVGAIDNVRSHSKGSPARYVMNNSVVFILVIVTE